jgi:hypothetical protein
MGSFMMFTHQILMKETTQKTYTQVRVALKKILKKMDGKAWTGFIWFRMGTSSVSCEHGSGSIKCRKFHN